MSTDNVSETPDAIPLIPFVEVVLGPRAVRMIGRISMVTGRHPDEVASHLLEAASQAPLRKPGPASKSCAEPAPKNQFKPESASTKPRRLHVPLTLETNRRLVRAARVSHLGKGQVAAVWLEQVRGKLPVFVQACRSQRLLHAVNLDDVQVDLEKAIRDGKHQQAPESSAPPEQVSQNNPQA